MSRSAGTVTRKVRSGASPDLQLVQFQHLDLMEVRGTRNTLA
jgi:hypothetical protein